MFLNDGYVNIEDGNSRTPLYSWVSNGHDSIVKLLLETDSTDAGMSGDRGLTPFAGLS